MIMRDWRQKSPDLAKRSDAHYRETNREERREYNKQWRKQNKEYWRIYQNRRLRTDLNYRLRNYIGRAIRRALKKDRKSVFHILGYSVDELRQHLESRFQPGMTWDNYGDVWHIDHITPKSWFKIEGENGIDEYELRSCWSLENLQPMWVEDNLEKKDRYISDIRLGKSHVTYDEFRTLIETNKKMKLRHS